MDNDPLPDLLKEHFSSTQLTDTRVSEILDGCGVARSAYRWRRRALVASSIAAVALAAFVMTLSGVFAPAPSEPVVTHTLSPASPAQMVAHAADQQQLVAAMVHANGCPSSEAIRPVFAHLQQEFVNDPVLFVSFDVSSACATRQAVLLSQCLGIGDAFKDHQHTGHILLVNPSGDLCDVVDQEQAIADAAASVRHNLHPRQF